MRHELLLKLYFCKQEIVPYHLVMDDDMVTGSHYLVVSPELYDRWIKFERDLDTNARIFKVLR